MKDYQNVVIGAGIVGIATAYYLAVKYRQNNILLVDKLHPMSLTTSKSGENFRDYWPQACMTDFTSRSLDLMEELIAEHGNVFEMRSSGYDFVSERVDQEIFPTTQPGADDSRLALYTDAATLRNNFPWCSDKVRQVAHIKRAGAIDVHALGALLLKRAKAAGLQLRYAEVVSIQAAAAGGYLLLLRAGDENLQVGTDRLVLAAGPFAGTLAQMLDIELPVLNICQHKFVMPDPLRVIPKTMPFTIIADSQFLDWDDAERELIGDDAAYQWLLEEFPAGLHIKPEGAGHIKLGWAYNRTPQTPRWEVEASPDFPGVVLRGASRYIPGLRQYRDKVPTPIVQFSGYYTRTAENWPLIGPLTRPGLFVAAALSGYGTMAACAAGELCAKHIVGEAMPSYAPCFHPNRYHDPGIQAEMASLTSDGQL